MPCTRKLSGASGSRVSIKTQLRALSSMSISSPSAAQHTQLLASTLALSLLCRWQVMSTSIDLNSRARRTKRNKSRHSSSAARSVQTAVCEGSPVSNSTKQLSTSMSAGSRARATLLLHSVLFLLNDLHLATQIQMFTQFPS